MLRFILIALISLVLTLLLPAAVNEVSRRNLQNLDARSLLDSGIYIAAYQRLIKSVMSSQNQQGQTTTTTVKVWQDHHGNLHFSNHDHAEGKNTMQRPEQTHTIVNQSHSMLSVPAWWAYGLMFAVWFILFQIFRLATLPLANRNRQKKKSYYREIKQHRIPDYNAPKTEFTELSPYETLGIEHDSSIEEARKAYKRKIAQYHPDKVAHLGEDLQEAAKKKTAMLNQAMEAIKRQDKATPE